MNDLEHRLRLLATKSWWESGRSGDPPEARIPTSATVAWALLRLPVEKLIPDLQVAVQPETEAEALDILHKVHESWSIRGRLARDMHPLWYLVDAYVQNPKPVEPNERLDAILPAALAMADPTNKRAASLLSWYSPAAHQKGQLILPGFENIDDPGAPALPVQLYRLGNQHPKRGGGRGAPLALRLFIEAILAAPQGSVWGAVSVRLTMDELRDRLYPGRRIRPSEFYEHLMRASEALDAMDSRIPWVDTVTGRGGLRRVVSMVDIGRSPDHGDDWIRFSVDLPPGSGSGPEIPPSLREWGVRSPSKYLALLNLAYRWWRPGQTRIPAKGGTHWLQVMDENRYPEITDAGAVFITRPMTSNKTRRHLVEASWRDLQELEAAGDLRIEGRRILPPGRGNGGAEVH